MKKTSLQSITAIILKELRHDRSFNQKKLSVSLNLSQSSITKIETGANAITLENLIKFSYFFHEDPGQIIEASERYGMWLESFFGYEITVEKVPLKEDGFLMLANDFYKSEIFKKIPDYYTIVETIGRDALSFPRRLSDYSFNTPEEDSLLLKSVFHYVTNESYRLGEIVPGHRRYTHVVKYKEINDVDAVMDFFSKENFLENRKKFMKRLHEKTFFLGSTQETKFKAR
jgi:transcriptional regulator with XRE-family HTH domain